jgi:hypothetical protein
MFENQADKGFTLLGLKAEFESHRILSSESHVDSEGKVIVRDFEMLVNPARLALFCTIKTD